MKSITEELSKFKSLSDVLSYFNNDYNSIRWLEKILWNGEAVCPYCGCKMTCKLNKRLGHCHHKHECYNCHRQFTVLVGTIFQSTKLPLAKWYAAIWLTTNNKKGVNSCALGRMLGVTQRTAWHLQQKISTILERDIDLGSPNIEVDEAFFGGRMRWKGVGKRNYLVNKVTVVGLAEDYMDEVTKDRDYYYKVKLVPVENRTYESIEDVLLEWTDRDQTLFTDQYAGYAHFARKYKRKLVQVNHDVKFVDMKSGSTTNRIELVWSAIKRQHHGIYHKLSKEYFNLYLNQFEYRWNSRGQTMVERTQDVFENVNIVLTWKNLKRNEN